MPLPNGGVLAAGVQRGAGVGAAQDPDQAQVPLQRVEEGAVRQAPHAHRVACRADEGPPVRRPPSTLNPQPPTPNPPPSTLNQASTLNPQPPTPNPPPSTLNLNPRPSTLSPKPQNP